MVSTKKAPCKISLAGAATGIIFVATKVLSRQTPLLSRQKACLPRQNFCCDKIMCVSTKYIFVEKKHVFYRDKSMLTFVATNIFCRDNIFVADKHNFVAPKPFSRETYFRHDKTPLLSRQKYACRPTKPLSRQIYLVAASILLSRQKRCFVATKMILVAAPANDNKMDIKAMARSVAKRLRRIIFC